VAGTQRVGIVFVSHSSKIADGLVELTRQMAPNVALIAAGGTDDNEIGTSFARVTAAVQAAESGGGVVVLCDLGSAILTTETALEFLDDSVRNRIRLVDAPLVEGGVAAGVAAETGGDLDGVVAAAQSAAGLTAQPATAQPATGQVPVPGPGSAAVATRTVTLINRDGLHARPAAEFAKLASTFDVQITVNGMEATSLLGIMSLGLSQGMAAEISASGQGADDAVRALAELLESGFGET